MDPGLPKIPPAFEIMIAFVGAFILVVLVAIVVSLVRSRKVLRDSGLDPLAAQAQIAVRLAQGPLATPARSLEARLAELEDLRRRGLITEAEHDAARKAALEQR
jgi:hypothetical protein